MLKVTIDNEEVLCNKDFTINEEMLNTSSTILNNVYPIEWEEDKDYVSRFYYPKDYSKCKIFDEIYHPETKEEVEGTSFSIEVDKTKQEELLSIKGQTSQSGTPTPESPIPVNVVSGSQVVRVCGKNLFDTDLPVNNTWINYQGQLTTINGCSIQKLPCEPNTTYTLSETWEVDDNVNNGGIIVFYDENGNMLSRNPIARLNDIVLTKTSPDNSSYMYVGHYVAKPKTIQLEKSNTPSTYEEYKGTDYEINLGKNLISSPMNMTARDVSVVHNVGNATLSLSGTGASSGNINNIGNTFSLQQGTYTICISYLSGVLTTNGTSYIRLRNSTDNVVLTGAEIRLTSSNYTTSQYATFTISEGVNAYLSIYVVSGSVYNDLTYNIQVVKGSTPDYNFSPYKTPIYLGEMRNTNNVVIAKDYIFRNTTENPLYDSNLEEGQWYIHKEINKVILNGTENWARATTATTRSSFSTPTFTDRLTTSITSEFYSSNFYYRGNAQSLNLGYAMSFGQNPYSRFLYIQVPTNIVAPGEIDNFKTWLGTHNTDVYYILNTPTNTLIEDEELISQLNSIQLINGLNNVSVSSPYLPGIIKFLYNYAPEYTEEDLYFCGIVKNTGEISLNPRYPHYCNVQVLDFKDFLSQGETLDFVITEKTIGEAIDQVIGTIAPYGFIKGNILLDDIDDAMGTYSTKDKTAYDVFNYIADITQSRWTTRMIDEDTIAIDFYDPNKLPMGTAIDYTNEWFCTHKINDLNYSYSSNDYRNKQVMLSGEVYSNIETTEILVADGYQTQFNTIDKIGKVSSLLLNGNPVSIITKDEYDLGYDADFYYQPGNKYFESVNLVSTGAILTIVYYAIIEGREVILNQDEISRVENMTGRKGVIARYENRNDATTTGELQAIGQSYLEYKGTPEIKLNITSRENTWNIGDRVYFNAPLDELKQTYMVKSKKIQRITTIDEMFYQYELTSSFNMEQDINYFDNQRFKSKGNIGEGEFISRNVDIENTANVIFYNLDVEEVEIEGNSTLQAELQAPLGVE